MFKARIWCFVLAIACSACSATQPKATFTEPRADAAPAAPASASSAESTLPVLRIGTSGDYAPFALASSSGKPSGFDVDIGEQLARDLGMRISWVTFRWPTLSEDVAAGSFDIAMGGITWQPVRSVSGYLTRAVASGGPCVLGDGTAPRIAVNRGGVLESWARSHFSGRELVVVDDNRSLPALLGDGRVGAIVTDSFERKSFARPGWQVSCEPLRMRKVYWVVPARARELGPRVDAWLRANSTRIQAAQERWFGERQRLDATTHLVDLLARRFAFMPIVAAIKSQAHLPIEDSVREREILAGMGAQAQRFELPELPLTELFRHLIELSKAVQRRQQDPAPLDLKTQIRPALDELGERIFEALVEARKTHSLATIGATDLEVMEPWLLPEEREELALVLRALAPAEGAK